MTTPDDRFRPGPRPDVPVDGPTPDQGPPAPPTWSVGDGSARHDVAAGYGTAAPGGTAPDDLDDPAPSTAGTRGGRGGQGLLVAALFTAAGAVLVLALAVGALAVAVGLGGGGSSSFGWTSSLEGGTGELSWSYGDDPDLDELWDACDAGDGRACDDLFEQTPADSEYEAFGWTCGERFDLSRDPGTCPAELD